MIRCKLGRNGPEVSRVGLGCMGMSGVYGRTDDAESIATIQSAIESGINLIDTGDFYGAGHNEMLIRRAIEGRRDRVVLSVKFGALRTPSGGFGGVDGRPDAVKNYCAYSLKRLGTDVIDIYRPARLDPKVPIEETVGAIAELVKSGYVRHLGLSEMGANTIRRAHAVHPIVDLQIEYAIVTRSMERQILPALRELGIGVTAYGVLSRGLLSQSELQAQGDFRAHLPRFTGTNLEHNRILVDALGEIARDKGITPTQLAIAWVLSRGEEIVPIPGMRTRKQLAETLAAVDVELSSNDLARVEQVATQHQIAGDRYATAQMQALDSEQG